MKKIAIYGAGGFGREVACLIAEINKSSLQWEPIGFFDDGLPISTSNAYGKIIGGIDMLDTWSDKLSIIFAIASPNIVKKLSERITNPLIDFPNIFAPGTTFYDHNSLKIGKGNLFFYGSRISCNVTIGDFNLCNSNVSLGHDVSLGSYNVLGPLVRLSGECRVGDMNFFGLHSAVLQGKKIGNNTRIGAGSIVMRNTKDGFLYFGNPAKKVKI